MSIHRLAKCMPCKTPAPFLKSLKTHSLYSLPNMAIDTYTLQVKSSLILKVPGEITTFLKVPGEIQTFLRGPGEIQKCLLLFWLGGLMDSASCIHCSKHYIIKMHSDFIVSWWDVAVGQLTSFFISYWWCKGNLYNRRGKLPNASFL